MGNRYDLAILGAGPAGYAAAMRAHDLGKRVLLVEKGRVGGTGIHTGALSSKTMWHLSNDYALVCRNDRGYCAKDVDISYRAVMDAVRAAVEERRDTLERQLEALARPSPSGGVVELRRGSARFVGPHAISIEDFHGNRAIEEADNVLVATGSTPRRPPGVDVDGERIVTSDHIESLERFPESMVVVGAGVVGCEYATIFASFGKTRISVLDRQPRILPFEDADVAEVVARSFESMGIVIHRASKLESIRNVGDRVEYVLALGEPIRKERDDALVDLGLLIESLTDAIARF